MIKSSKILKKSFEKQFLENNEGADEVQEAVKSDKKLKYSKQDYKKAAQIKR